MKKICVTGANGFIGKALCKALKLLGKPFRGFVRNLDSFMSSDYMLVGDINSEINWKDKLRDCDCIIHCAGKASSTNNIDELASYILVNTEATKRLAEQAVVAGVKRFIFLSSVKVNGESTGKFDDVKIFKNDDMPNPQDYYALSKFKAENILWEIALKTGLEVVVVRFPLVYGNGVKGNLANLIKLINFRIPLPFGGIKNKRSLIGIDNAVDFLIRCTDHSNAKGKTFLVCDGEDLSTSKLICLISLAMNQSVKLFSLPITLINFFGFILRRQNEIDRLTGSLQIDNSYAQEILNWTPPVSIEEGIRRMVKSK